MPRQEGHPAARDLADERCFARLAERRSDPDLLGVGQELVKAGAADNPDVRDRGHRGQATFSLEDPPEEEAAELAEDDAAESLPGFADEEEPSEGDDESLPGFDEDDGEPDEPLPRLSVR
ncbi:MAG TPA: hypothetical protein VFO01_04170 [Trebonia sp.]|nr:hypothetical protein [Trebonia sp.]